MKLDFTQEEMRRFIERQKDEFDKSIAYEVRRDLSGRWSVHRYMHGQGWIPWLAPEGGIKHLDHWLEHALPSCSRIGYCSSEAFWVYLWGNRPSMTKEDKIKRFKELAKVNEVEEIDASLIELPEEVEAEAPKPIEEVRMSDEEIAHFEVLREQKKARFAQLAGLVEEGAEVAPVAAPAKRSPKMVLENAAPKKAKLKLSSLSEGLRKEVAKLVKEGKTKISQFPADVKAKVLKEMWNEGEPPMPMAEDGMAASATAPHPGYPELDPLIATMSNSVRNVILKMMDAHGFTDFGDRKDPKSGDPEMPFKAEYIMKGIINNLTNEA